jgi:hypothetical protein
VGPHTVLTLREKSKFAGRRAGRGGGGREGGCNCGSKEGVRKGGEDGVVYSRDEASVFRGFASCTTTRAQGVPGT